MLSPDQLPEFKAKNVAITLRLVRTLPEDFRMLPYIGVQLVGSVYDDFNVALRECLPRAKEISLDTVEACTAYLLDEELSLRKLSELIWRMAGNLPQLYIGRPVYPWDGQARPEWVPLQILAADQTRTMKGKYATRYTYQVLAGSACPMIGFKTWVNKYVTGLLASRMGFTAPWGKQPFKDARELVGMRLHGLLEPKEEKKLHFDHVRITPSFLKWNQDYIKMRARGAQTQFRCPMNYPDTVACYLCPIGQDRCPAAIHPVTYVKQMCESCNKLSFYDPSLGDRESCLRCELKNKT
jgi:hypothetical protein